MTHEMASLVKAWNTLKGREVGGPMPPGPIPAGPTPATAAARLLCSLARHARCPCFCSPSAAPRR